MRLATTTLAILIATPALADPGHFAASHGHNHWLAAAALVLAAVIGAVAFRTGRRAKAAKRITERRA
ncbi:MAG TPA: DUF6732 family protein [Thermohalobaculum sp.]|nr:DUF6732 family protein [Thermohalobaculum sp.]